MGVQNSEFQYFFFFFFLGGGGGGGGVQKNEYFWGYEDFVDIFGGSSKNWASLRVISMQFRSRYRIGISFLDC